MMYIHKEVLSAVPMFSSLNEAEMLTLSHKLEP